MKKNISTPVFRFDEAGGCFFFQNPAVNLWERDCGPCHLFWMGLEGRGRIQSGRENQRIGPGNACLFLPGDTLRVRQDRGHSIRNFVAALDFTKSPYARGRRPALVRMNDLVGVTVLARKLIEAWNAGDAISQLQTNALMQSLLLEYDRMQQSADTGASIHDAKLIELANRIRLEPELPWRVAACAREVGLCRSQFTRLFQRLTANTPMRFIVKCRMQRAGRMLLETPLSVSEIAEIMGYRDVFYFSKHFRLEMGKPPSQYRRDKW